MLFRSRQYGAIEVDDLDHLLAVTHLLTRPRPARGQGLCIYTFSGGTAALAADIAGVAGLSMARFDPATTAALKALLPDFGSIVNPVDTTADILRDTRMADECLRIVCSDPNVGVVLYPIPMDYGEVTESIARSIVAVGAQTDTPIVPVWMSRRRTGGFDILEQAGLLPFVSISTAITAVDKVLDPHVAHTSANAAAHADRDGIEALNEAQAKAMLAKAGLPIPQGQVAADLAQALEHAASIGYPVALKIVSPDIAHKTEMGGVKLNIRDACGVRVAHEAIRAQVAQHAPTARIDGILVERMAPAGGREVLIGVHRDPAFGLVLTFGLGGVFVEVLRDVTHRLIPISPLDAHAMIGELRHASILKGVRGQGPIDFPALEKLLLQVSDFAHAHAATLMELELNPVWVGGPEEGVVALDALLAMAKTPIT